MKQCGTALMVLALLVSSAGGQSPSTAKADTAIRLVLQAQVEAWNHHDLDAFMAGYWRSPDLTFFSGTTETKGWEPTLARYRRNYQSEGRGMGTLSFSDLQVQVLGLHSAFVRGQFHLIMPDGKQPHGLFTLILRKFDEGWRIVHDHTCAE
jgi:beta-aspartyl-peptidase (threonine type)